MADKIVLPQSARCGTGTIDGAVWRPGDGNKHLGPPEHLGIHLWSQLFSTRCGLDAKAGDWRKQAQGEDRHVYDMPALKPLEAP